MKEGEKSREHKGVREHEDGRARSGQVEKSVTRGQARKR